MKGRGRTGGSRRGLTLRRSAPACCVLGMALAAACYSTGDGTAQTNRAFYYPVGLVVSAGGNVLYAANSDFDLQFNGGTVQSYDLTLIRNDTVRLILGLYTGAPDAGVLDSGAVDASAQDAADASDSGAADSGAPDEGLEDSGALDAGMPDGQTSDGEAGDASLDAAVDGAENEDASVDASEPNTPEADAAPAICAAVDAGAEDAALPFSSGGPNLAAACPQTNEDPSNPSNLQDPNDPNAFNGANGRLPLGEACAPAMTSQWYWRDEVTIGAFATDIQLSKNKDRLFIPVRGDATLTWIDVISDADCYRPAAYMETAATYAPFRLHCNAPDTLQDRSCDAQHHAGTLQDPGNTRQLAMPGEPFGMALSDDGTAIALTHQTSPDTSLYLSGLLPGNTVANSRTNFDPSIQFILDNVPTGGIGIVAVPHDPAAIPVDPTNPSPPYIRPSFLQTSDQAAEIDLLGYYSDEGYQGLTPAPDSGANLLVDAGAAVQVGSSNLRPFLVKEQTYSVTVNSNGTNSRGIVIDPTPRIACELALPAGTPTTDPAYVSCAQTPARVFIANRTPASLILGQIGGMSGEGNTYNPDLLTIFGNYPLSTGPSNIYLAPIVDKSGHYALRVFIVGFDSQTITVWDPDAQQIENVITTGPGPFAMAFDPFDLNAVATRAAVPFDPRSRTNIIAKKNPALDGKPALRAYRFGYIASFTDSFVQIIDLDQSFQDDRLPQGDSTFENVVYSLGLPTQPVGSN